MNIYEVAREAGVSIATISRVVNGKKVVSAKTREKVEAVLKKYNYTPDPAARNLVMKTTKSVAILTSDVRDAYCSGVCREVERRLNEIGYTAMLSNTGGTSKGIGESVANALAHRMDAIVTVGMSKGADSEIKEAAAKVPCVVINNFIDSPKVHCVVCDESYGMMLAVSDLVSHGKHNILFIADGSDDSYSALKMSDGFSAGMAMNDLSPENRTESASRGFDGGYACADRLIREHRQFDGVICDDDTTAAGFMKSLRENFFVIPDDVAVISFHNTDVAQCTNPTLTSVDCRSENAGKEAVKVLKEIFDKGEAEKKTIVLPRLIKRESTESTISPKRR